jgi:hypothetical protein
MSKALKQELKMLGVYLITIYPGLVSTEFHARAVGGVGGGILPAEVTKAIIEAVELKKDCVYVPRHLAILRVLGPHLKTALLKHCRCS